MNRLLPNLDIELVKRTDKVSVDKVALDRRAVVECTMDRLMQFRRVTLDYERTVQSAIGWIHTAMIEIMLRRLA